MTIPPCIAHPLDVFFAVDPRPALNICATCDPTVRAACLADELAVMRNLPAGSSHGIRGGTTPEQREAMLGPRGPLPPRRSKYGPPPQPINHGTVSGYSRHRQRGEDPCNACHNALCAASRTRRAAQRDEAWVNAHIDQTVMRNRKRAALTESWRLREELWAEIVSAA